jgi:antirestriction protein ArdC
VKRDLYSDVSARIVAELERGAAPWIKPWSATPGQNVPQNVLTNRPYSGCNVILLWLARSRGWSTPRFAVRFMDGEAVFTHVPSAPGKPLNVGRALRVAIAMYRSRRAVQKRVGFGDYDRAIPVPEIFQVRCLETDELFDVRACNKATAAERKSSNPHRAAAMRR